MKRMTPNSCLNLELAIVALACRVVVVSTHCIILTLDGILFQFIIDDPVPISSLLLWLRNWVG